MQEKIYLMLIAGASDCAQDFAEDADTSLWLLKPIESKYCKYFYKIKLYCPQLFRLQPEEINLISQENRMTQIKMNLSYFAVTHNSFTFVIVKIIAITQSTID